MKLAWLAGAAAAAVVAAAVVDAVRRDDEPEPRPARTVIEGRDELAETLAGLGVRGTLRLRDETCGVTELELPSLERTPDVGPCIPNGVVSPDGGLVARCVEGGIEVYSTFDGELQRLSPGCGPAWLPDGEMTAVLDDEVVAFRGCPTCAETLIPQAELERAARLHPAIPDRSGRVRAIVEGVAWVSARKAAVAISPRLRGADFGPIGTIAFFERGRLLPTAQPQHRITGGPLAVSPRGTYVTQTADLILRADGSLLGLPQHLQQARALAWSPDERFLALATSFAVVIVPVASLERFDRTGGGLRSVTIPQAAAGLAWRADR